MKSTMTATKATTKTTTTTTMMISRVCYLIVLAAGTEAFEMPNLAKIFKGPSSSGGNLSPFSSPAKTKAALLEAVSFTENGKNATPEQQMLVLSLVGELEEAYPVSDTLLSDPSEIKALDGTWFLQYTSPSKVGDSDEFPDTWKPNFASEGDSNIETRQIKSKGTVSAAGITVDTSNRAVKQIFNVEESTVFNEVELDFGVGRAGGQYRQSPNVANRAVVSFNEASVTWTSGFKINLGWVFAIVGVLKQSKDNGWLETTYLDSDMRIGRGNKGTMFVLTRDRGAVQP